MERELKDENVLHWQKVIAKALKEDPFAIVYVIGVILVLLGVIILFIKSRARLVGQSVLLTGLCHGGKTSIFTRLVYGNDMPTVTSQKGNTGIATMSNGKQMFSIQLVDIPGYERLFHQYLSSPKLDAKAVIFVVDSTVISSNIKDAAGYLYSIMETLMANYKTAVPILVACNKQDILTAKSPAVVQSLLEKEFNILRETRVSQLANEGGTPAKYLGDKNKDFEFKDIAKVADLTFIETKGNSLEGLTEMKNWLMKYAA